MNESTTIGKLYILKDKGIGGINNELKQHNISVEDVINIETQQPGEEMCIVWFRKRKR